MTVNYLLRAAVFLIRVQVLGMNTKCLLCVDLIKIVSPLSFMVLLLCDHLNCFTFG